MSEQDAIKKAAEMSAEVVRAVNQATAAVQTMTRLNHALCTLHSDDAVLRQTSIMQLEAALESIAPKERFGE